MMEYVNIVLGVLAIANGWLLILTKNSQRTIEQLRSADSQMSEKIAGIQLLIAGAYLTREEFRHAMQTQTQSIVQAIEKIDAKVDRKADK